MLLKLNFSDMDVGTFPFRFVRALMVAGTGGAEINECLLALKRTRSNSDKGWVREWATIAQQASETAERAMQSGQTVTARNAYLRASNYYRTAMFSLPPTDDRLFEYLTFSRDYFHQAARLFSPQIELLDIPFGNAHLPGYFLSAGPSKQPTLIALNGGDTTNEELVHMIGFAAAERGWNCLMFEGPGQWSALQLNPGLHLQVDYELPVKAVVDYLMQRNNVDPDKIALIGYSLSTLLGARAVAFEKRISACVLSGGPVVDVNEAWDAVRPLILQKTLPRVLDFFFTLAEKFSPRVAAFNNHFRWSFGVSTVPELMEAFRPFNITGLAPKIECPVLILPGEAEYAQTDAKTILSSMRFVGEIGGPVSIHEFTYEEGWAASHCQMGALSAAHAVIFDWLDKTVNKKESPMKAGSAYDWKVIRKHHDTKEIEKLLQSIHVSAI